VVTGAIPVDLIYGYSRVLSNAGSPPRTVQAQGNAWNVMSHAALNRHAPQRLWDACNPIATVKRGLCYPQSLDQ
jgi:hypothetical protein